MSSSPRYYSAKTLDELEHTAESIAKILASVQADIAQIRERESMPDLKSFVDIVEQAKRVRMMHVYHLHQCGYANKDIAQQYGLTAPRVSQLIKEYRTRYLIQGMSVVDFKRLGGS